MKNCGSDIGTEQVSNVCGKGKKVLRGLFLIVTALVFGSGILLMSFLAPSDLIKAEQPVVNRTGAEMFKQDEASPAAEKAETIEYYLPYPGILPDNPMYKIKVMRDKVTLWLEFDQEKKAQKELFLADKRINAAVFLVDGGKIDLGVTTATKAEKYLEQAVSRMIKLDASGRDVKSLMAKLDTAIKKHVEIVEKLRVKVTGQEGKSLELSLATTKMYSEKVGQMMLENK